ncbi:hypothetical protein ACFL1X_01385, partial [Candidatus Hydrogenedentota bacterium]
CADGNTEWNARLRRRERLDTIADFVNVFNDTLRECGKQALVRLWCSGESEEWAAALPKGVPYVFKYSGFDCCDCTCDPVVKFWKDRGHEVWVSKEISGGENAGPIVWHDPEFFHMTAEESAKAGATGIMGIDNTDHGTFGMPYAMQHANLTAYCHYTSNEEPYDEARWVDNFEKYYPGLGKAVFDALKLYARLVLMTDKILWGEGEGFMWYNCYNFVDVKGWPGTLGISHPVPEWVAPGICTMNEYVHHLRFYLWGEETISKLEAGRKSIVTLLEEATESAREGLELLKGLQDSIPIESMKEFRILLASAALAFWTGKTWIHLVKARVEYAAVNSPGGEASVKRGIAESCLANLDEAIAGYKRQVECLFGFPRDMMKFERIFNKDPRKQTANGQVAHWKNERAKVAGEFAELLSDDVWMFP